MCCDDVSFVIIFLDRVCKKNIWTKRRWREGGREYSVSDINVVNGNIERESFVERMWKMWRTSLFFKWCVTGEEDIDCSVVELESRDIWRIVFHSKLDHEKLFSSIHLELLKQSTCRDARWLFEKFKEEAQIFVSFLLREVYFDTSDKIRRRTDPVLRKYVSREFIQIADIYGERN